MNPSRGVVGKWRGLARSDLVHIGLAGGHFEMRRFGVGGLDHHIQLHLARIMSRPDR
jgi:hypothetical protein